MIASMRTDVTERAGIKRLHGPSTETCGTVHGVGMDKDFTYLI